MIFGFLYDLCLHVYLVVRLPKILRQWSKYKKIFTKRLGRGFPLIEKRGKKLIWIHAVSLGETKAVIPLMKRLKALPEAPLVLLSTATETGHIEGLKNGSAADYHVFLPLDISYIIRPIVKRVAPDTIILTETDFWYHFQNAAKKEGAQLLVVNGKISERTLYRLSKFPFLAKRLLNPVDHFYLQGELYRTRFEQLNLEKSKMTVTGNIKLDAEVERCDVAALKQRLNLTQEPVITLGSTHAPEEALWIEALKKLWQDFPDLKALIVPRHPERFPEVAKLLQNERISFSRWSEGGIFNPHQVVLVDAMGILRTCYQISTIAFVGGSFIEKVGGHNILEPAFYGKPVLFGPYMHSQPDLLDLVKTYKSGLQISPTEIVPTLKNLLTNKTLCDQFGSRGLTLTQSARGSLNHTFNLLQTRLYPPHTAQNS
jgi:3-deoxy-D-manno-octulosonic-acid transferase